MQGCGKGAEWGAPKCGLSSSSLSQRRRGRQRRGGRREHRGLHLEQLAPQGRVETAAVLLVQLFPQRGQGGGESGLVEGLQVGESEGVLLLKFLHALLSHGQLLPHCFQL